MRSSSRISVSSELSGLLLVAFVGVVWGTIPLLLRAADGASVVKVFFRVAFAGAAIWSWLAATRRTREVTGLPLRKIGQLAVQGAILTLNWVLFLTALDTTTVAVAELLGYTGPVFVAVLAPMVTREPFDRRIIIPLALALGGIVVILAPQGLLLRDSGQLFGAVLAFLSALTYATLLLRSKRMLKGVTGLGLMAVEYPVATLLLLPFTVFAYARGDGPTGAVSYAALLTLGIVHTAFTGVLFLAAIRRVRTDRVALFTYAEPVAAVVFAALFLGEGLTVWTVLGGAMVVVAGISVARLGTPEGPMEAPEPEAGRDFEHAGGGTGAKPPVGSG
jgi:drug/metabolite transporter (DMT)-like permease